MKDDTVTIDDVLGFGLLIQLFNWVIVEVILRNCGFGCNDFAVDIEWQHVVSEIDLRVLHFSQLTLWLISISRGVPLVNCHVRVRSPNAFILIFNQFDCRGLNILLLWLSVTCLLLCIQILNNF